MTGVTRPPADAVWRYEGQSMRDVLVALAAIRTRFALAEAGDAEHAHPRNFVMTLVAIAANEAEERVARRACRMILEQHPAQAIIVRDQPSLEAGMLEANIATEVNRPETASAAQYELLTLHVRGASGDHLAELLEPLLDSGVPTYLWWVGTPPFGKRAFDEALRTSDELVVDSARFESPYLSFLSLARLVTSPQRHQGVADFQWSRLRPWRESIAQFFGPADRRPLMRGISGVGVDYAGEARGNRIAASLLIGWLASTLGWQLQRAAGGTGGVVAAHYLAPGSKPIEVNFRSVPRASLASGEIMAVRLSGAAGGRTFNLSIQRDPERPRRIGSDVGFNPLHQPEGGDEAGLELAARRAEWHRDVLHENIDALHHTATGDAPGESVPKHPTVFNRD
ncbi:MAG TPA: glucose-6-phosphate dehydrogenase assembly protein OpcA, partial [Patescibacteria group bacterium]|nr:glucose-6-phosphate dehydrogenase assembly protein OpcA [Patescibacteria group bacterium]